MLNSSLPPLISSLRKFLPDEFAPGDVPSCKTDPFHNSRFPAAKRSGLICLWEPRALRRGAGEANYLNECFETKHKAACERWKQTPCICSGGFLLQMTHSRLRETVASVGSLASQHLVGLPISSLIVAGAPSEAGVYGSQPGLNPDGLFPPPPFVGASSQLRRFSFRLAYSATVKSQRREIKVFPMEKASACHARKTPQNTWDPTGYRLFLLPGTVFSIFLLPTLLADKLLLCFIRKYTKV